jgi:hypothetical protein
MKCEAVVAVAVVVVVAAALGGGGVTLTHAVLLSTIPRISK